MNDAVGAVAARVAADATAVSIDGRHFHFAGTTDDSFEPGTLVVLRAADRPPQLGQVDDANFAIGMAPQGTGRVLGVLSADLEQLDNRTTVPFPTATMRRATATTVEALYARAGATLPIGTLLAAEGVPARLLANRLNRHTFWCGQSGSGKTYALGVVLEQILLQTTLPLVIFDPNADFVRIREPQPSEARSPGGQSPEGQLPEAVSRGRKHLSERDIRVLRPSSPSALCVRFTDMPLAAKAAVLHLDPLDDRAEYNELIRLEETVGVVPAEKVASSLRDRGTSAGAQLAARVENLRVINWSVWAGARESATDIIHTRPDATVLDLGGFEYPDEPLVVAMAVLDDLWAKREERRPVLIVIDEAHNLCSPERTSPLHVAVRERIIQIAAEGRKFGLWLLLSTQRPSRIHPSIISQCDNLALMKMTSPIDLDELGTIFGFVPPAMLARASRFTQGEALFAGGFVPAPSMVKVGDRLTREGGADVRVPLR